MKRHIVHRLLAVLALALAAGCGTGEYNSRFAVSLTNSGRKAASDQLQALLHAAATPINDASGQATGATIRIPASLDANSKSLPASDGRAQPPFLKIPGLGYAIERLLDDDAGQFSPVYCYLGAVPKTGQPADATLAEVQQQAAAAFSGAAWKDTQAGSNAVKLLSVGGQQDFDGGQNGGPVVKLDGRLDLYFHDAPTHLLFVGFRAPTAQATKYRFFEAAQAAMATLSVP
jgi:hypothetical protein